MLKLTLLVIGRSAAGGRLKKPAGCGMIRAGRRGRVEQVEGFYFDTVNTIAADCGREVLQDALDRCAFFNELLSKTVPGSDVWNCNHAQGRPTRLSEHTAKILAMALELYRASDGAFNVALGGAPALWRFKDAEPALPDPAALAEAVSRADCSGIRLEGDTVTLPPGAQIDLGGIAKGYIADRVADFLREAGVKNALLNFGGNIVTVGKRPDGEPWRVGLQTPGAARGSFWAWLPCADGTLVTSGVYERGFVRDGELYHHVLDPRSGMPVQNGVLSVTVAARDSMLADGLATALLVLGPEKGFPLARRCGAEAVFFLRGGEVRYSPGLALGFVKG